MSLKQAYKKALENVLENYMATSAAVVTSIPTTFTGAVHYASTGDINIVAASAMASVGVISAAYMVERGFDALDEHKPVGPLFTAAGACFVSGFVGAASIMQTSAAVPAFAAALAGGAATVGAAYTGRAAYRAGQHLVAGIQALVVR